jgi:cytochrome c oxidase subunit IV
MSRTRAATASDSVGLRRSTGLLFLTGALTFAAAATVLSATFDWPGILRMDANVVLPAFSAGGDTLVWTWFVTAWTYAILLVPILLLPRVLGRTTDPALRVASIIGAASVVFSLIGFLRWVFVVPALARVYETGDDATKVATEAAWLAQHQFGGALLGEVQSCHDCSAGLASPLAASICSTKATSSPPRCLTSLSSTSPDWSAAPVGGCGSPR